MQQFYHNQIKKGYFYLKESPTGVCLVYHNRTTLATKYCKENFSFQWINLHMPIVPRFHFHDKEFNGKSGCTIGDFSIDVYI